MPSPIYGFYKYTRYLDRQSAEYTLGFKLPPWDRNRALKRFVIPQPDSSAIEHDEIRGDEIVLQPVLAKLSNGFYKNGPEGQPTLGKIRLTVAEAMSYNFEPYDGKFPVLGEDGMTSENIRNSQTEIMPPLNLPDGATVRYAATIGGGVVVYLKGEMFNTQQTAAAQIDRLASIEGKIDRLMVALKVK